MLERRFPPRQDKNLVYSGKAFMSFTSLSSNQSIECDDIQLLQLENGIYELQSQKQAVAFRILITTDSGRSWGGIVVEQHTGITRFVQR
ncbi:hypothetical protein [Pseudomonas sp. PDM13]|uniref:hypothetical protein n=1 Tax=Pseudomonas sp. PDM13 TaxID=2769255 RepID=UPI0021DF83F6|nr:hypothetical protein [Pseudomonas sp. PDM13]MCU9949878.1 hypothetical protein [Pseudomonas sp. PDM13]